VAAFAVRFRLYQWEGDPAVRTICSLNLDNLSTQKRNTIAKTLGLAALAALALFSAPTAKADNKGCSNATLNGSFSDKDSGWIIPGPNAAPLPFAGVNVDTFDGNGNLTITGTSSVSGSVAPGTLKGTYTVNPDCTGTYSVEGGGLSVHAFFVIDDSGDELQIVITDPGNVILCVARRQFPVGDWRQ
jgi:hypothetical protein